jgi:cytochrome c oxidase assembly factor CtaG
MFTPSASAHGPGGHHDKQGRPTPTVGPQSWSELWRTWAFEPGVVIPLAMSLWLYLRGIRKLWTTAGVGRGVTKAEAACFLGGWFALFIALVSPLHPWGAVLFSAHMSQHEVLMLVAAPLLVLGKPLVAFLKALPSGTAQRLVAATRRSGVERLWNVFVSPFAAWLLHLIILWTWHVPVLYHAAIDSEFVHALQHLSFLGSALLFWWAVLGGPQRALGYGAAVLYMFTTAVHSGLLGALIALAARLWYPVYESRTAAWGLTPLEDQQIGGIIMWVPACTVYLVAGLVLFVKWLADSERRVRRWEAAPIAAPEVGS